MDMRFFIQEAGKEFRKIYDRRRIMLGTLHLATGLGIFWLTGWIGAKVDSSPLRTLLVASGVVVLLYCLYRAIFLLFHITIKGKGSEDAGNARQAFAAQRLTALGLPAIGFGLLVLEGLLLLLLREIPSPVGLILMLIVLPPLVLVNLSVFWFVFLGGKFFYPLLIEKPQGLRDAVLSLIGLVRAHTLPLLLYTLFAGLLYFVVYLFISLGAIVARLVPVLISGDSFSLVTLAARGGISFLSVFDPPQSLAMLSSGDGLIITGGVLVFAISTIIVAFLLSFLLNIVVGTTRAMYETIKREPKP